MCVENLEEIARTEISRNPIKIPGGLRYDEMFVCIKIFISYTTTTTTSSAYVISSAEDLTLYCFQRKRVISCLSPPISKTTTTNLVVSLRNILFDFIKQNFFK